MNQVFFFHIHKIVSRVSKEAFKKSFVEGIKIFLKKKKTKNEDMHVKDIKIFLKRKKKKKRHYRRERHKNFSGYEKQKIAKCRSNCYVIYKKITARSLNKV